MRRAFDELNTFLDKYVLPWPVRFLTFRFTILITIALLVPLILFANNTELVLAVNSYLNTMSVAVSSIVLLYAMLAEKQQREIAEMQGKVYERRPAPTLPDLRSLHPLGVERFAKSRRRRLEP